MRHVYQQRFSHQSRVVRPSVVPLLLASLCAFVIIKAAWLSDDAYITLRTIDNFWSGYGLRWNVVERVQAYTHPLWMLLLAAAYGVTRDGYFTTIGASLACAIATIVLLIRRLPATSAALALLMLISSRAFVEFSTSGLENPLSHLLLVMFWLEASWGEPAPHGAGGIRRPTRFCVLAALCCLTRADLALLVGPRVMAWLWARPARALRSLALAALPLVAWYAFATIYYGTPLPNTILAKLNTGLPLTTLATQGLYYLRESLMRDPLTLSTMIAACVWATVRPEVNSIALAIGLVLHILFVVRVGGDFMSGRFLSAPFVCAVMYVAQQAARALTPRPLALAAAAAIVIAVGVVTPKSHWRVWTPLPAANEGISGFHGIVDERRYYYPYTGLFAVLQEHRPLDHPWAADAWRWRGTPRVVAAQAVGLAGFHAGPGVHIVDRMAVADPLLARLAARPGSRIGHFEREVPDGYLQGLDACLQRTFPHAAVAPNTQTCLDWPAETNRLADPGLASHYDLIHAVTQRRLFDADRLRAIVRLNTGW